MEGPEGSDCKATDMTVEGVGVLPVIVDSGSLKGGEDGSTLRSGRQDGRFAPHTMRDQAVLDALAQEGSLKVILEVVLVIVFAALPELKQQSVKVCNWRSRGAGHRFGMVRWSLWLPTLSLGLSVGIGQLGRMFD